VICGLLNFVIASRPFCHQPPCGDVDLRMTPDVWADDRDNELSTVGDRAFQFHVAAERTRNSLLADVTSSLSLSGFKHHLKTVSSPEAIPHNDLFRCTVCSARRNVRWCWARRPSIPQSLHFRSTYLRALSISLPIPPPNMTIPTKWHWWFHCLVCLEDQCSQPVT